MVATPPQAQGGVSIFYNEGSDAIEISKDLSPINGYYVDYTMLLKSMDTLEAAVDLIPPGTPVMVELKSGYGVFFYSTKISGAKTSESLAGAIGIDRWMPFFRSSRTRAAI